VSVRPAAVLTDIEGTTTPIAFVHEALFPFARARLAAFVAAHPAVGGAPTPGLDILLGQMDRDEKDPVLKAIQGMIWEEGYASGELRGAVYEDVPPALRRWVKAGLRLFVYSSGSVAAQKLLFAHSVAGDLSGLFQGFFDTNVGLKRETGSYARICRGTNLTPGEVLFLSDVEAELDAAAEVGLLTCQLARPADGTVASVRHKVATDFSGVATAFGLPVG
jgi:enolase-phosphatase E1